MKKIIHIDLDNTLADYLGMAKIMNVSPNDAKHIPVFFRNLKHIENAINSYNILNKYFDIYPSVKNKIMYGTDFFAVSDEYSDVSSYIKVIDLLNVDEKEKRDILYNNVCRAYNTNF